MRKRARSLRVIRAALPVPLPTIRQNIRRMALSSCRHASRRLRPRCGPARRLTTSRTARSPPACAVRGFPGLSTKRPIPPSAATRRCTRTMVVVSRISSWSFRCATIATSNVSSCRSRTARAASMPLQSTQGMRKARHSATCSAIMTGRSTGRRTPLVKRSQRRQLPTAMASST